MFFAAPEKPITGAGSIRVPDDDVGSGKSVENVSSWQETGNYGGGNEEWPSR